MTTTDEHKKRRPPTFRHLPESRAIKLKQDWVLKQKIKTKWKSEKRKLQQAGSTDPAISELGTEAKEQITSIVPKHKPRSKRPEPETKPMPSSSKTTSNDTFREMAREAYSPASLHTYRSNFSKSDQRRGGEMRAGRGQPNMKLRMNVMLEKIKRDVT